MIYTAKNLLSRLTHLTLAGIEDGQLEFIGTDKAWTRVTQEDDGVNFNNKDEDLLNDR